MLVCLLLFVFCFRVFSSLAEISKKITEEAERNEQQGAIVFMRRLGRVYFVFWYHTIPPPPPFSCFLCKSNRGGRDLSAFDCTDGASLILLFFCFVFSFIFAQSRSTSSAGSRSGSVAVTALYRIVSIPYRQRIRGNGSIPYQLYYAVTDLWFNGSYVVTAFVVTARASVGNPCMFNNPPDSVGKKSSW